jgi:hypothetical protein
MLRCMVGFILMMMSFTAPSQENGTSLFPDGYFSNPVVTPYGIVASNEMHSAIYLINNGRIDELISAPGAGRFLHFNREKTKVGFKLINPQTELQVPAIIDLETRDIVRLEVPTARVGQVSFADDGSIAYVMDTELIVRRGEETTAYDLDVYSNLSPISPDGSKVIYKDTGDQMWIMDLQTRERYRITEPGKGYREAVWSPLSDKVLYSTIGTELYYFDVDRRSASFIGEGEHPDWSPSGDLIVFHRREIDFQNVRITGSNLFLHDVAAQTTKQLTYTDEVFEMDARFTPGNETVTYHTYDRREIRQIRLNREAVDKEVPLLFNLDRPLESTSFTVGEKAAGDTVIAGGIDWVHIHQVYDTRADWDQGRVCCGATTIAQVFATYGIFTPWPLETYGRTSYFGRYISDPYTYNDVTYTGFTGRWPSGGHGFLWHGGGSPSSRSVPYIINHGVSETQRDASVSWTTVTTELDLGYSYVLCSTGLTSGHIVLAIGTYGDQHTVVVNDPYGDKNAGSYGYQYNGRHAIYDWADANTGRQKVTPIAWGVRVRFDPTDPPVIVSYAPDTEDSVNAASRIEVTFSQPMKPETVENAFSIVPETGGTFTWSNYNRTLNFQPIDLLERSSTYTVRIDTSAKNLFDFRLEEALEFGFTTKSRERLAIERMYPLENQIDISTTVQFRFWFDAPITRGSLLGNIHLYNIYDERISLANMVVETVDGNGYLSFEPRDPLQNNHTYRLYLYGDITDENGYPLQDTLVVAFHTDPERHVQGSVLDDFVSLDSWKVMNTDEGSANIDTLLTRLLRTTAKKVVGTNSARLEYRFLEDEGVAMVCNLSDIVVHCDETENFGLWVFGDLSGNLLEFHFRGNGDEEIAVVIDTLDYTGWKLMRLNMDEYSDEGEFTFLGIALRKQTYGAAESQVFIDRLEKDIVTPVYDDPDAIAGKQFRLHQNYPNPFNPSTRIRYDIPAASRVRLTVYNLIGQLVATLVNEEQHSGYYEVTFDATNLPSGLYMYRLQAGDFIETKRLLYLK